MNEQCDHQWRWVEDWGGDPEVIGGTFYCSYYVCDKCGEEDCKRQPPKMTFEKEINDD